MAGDWIKMRTDLYRDPKVCLMADNLLDRDGKLSLFVSQITQRDMCVTRNVMRNVTVGALVTVWGVARHRGKRVDDDLLVRDATISVVDDIAELPGFGDAMESVGWAVQSEEGLVFPRFFEEFNVEPGIDARESNAERQRRWREKRNALRNVTSNEKVTQKVTLEKSREEESKRRDKTKNKSLFVKPTLQEVSDYCRERNSGIDPEAFVDHYERCGWKLSNGLAVKDWKACVRTWEKNPLNKKPVKVSRVATAEDLARYNAVDGGLG